MDIHHLHLFVEDAEYWRDWFLQKLEFAPLPLGTLAPRGTWGVRGGDIYILLSQPHPGHPAVVEFLRSYGMGMGDLGFRVKNLALALQAAQGVGAKVIHPPTAFPGGRYCQVAGWGSLRHTLVEYYQDVPSQGREFREAGFQDMAVPNPAKANFPFFAGGRGPSPGADAQVPWLQVDHGVLNVPDGQLQTAARWYEEGFGFQRQQSFAIDTGRSGLRSIVLQHPQGSATLPINEPTSPNSQIQEFLDYHRGPGIQHVAFQAASLVMTLPQLRQRGMVFLPVPATYYDYLGERPGFWAEAGDWQAIAQEQILVDWATHRPQARLLQTFTQPLFGVPTLFLELIERQGPEYGELPAQGFGEGNFRALFEAMERQQQQRGSL